MNDRLDDRSNLAKAIFAFIFAAVIFSSITAQAYAATIHGNIYDIALEPEQDVRIEINTIPKQVFISKDSSYSFNVPEGDYILNASTDDSYAHEKILITDNEGDYVLDIVLEPSIDYPELQIDDIPEASTSEIVFSTYHLALIVGGAILIIGIIIISILYLTKQDSTHKQMQEDAKRQDPLMHDEYREKTLRIIKENKRITQKELRKELPLSEGKISLLISQLESEGRIKKIKKGRGNILVFVKD